MRIITLAAVISLASFHAAALDIVTDGKPRATIIVESAPAAKGRKPAGKGARQFVADDEHAADILADWIEKMSGCRLQVSQTAAAEGAKIYVGAAAVKAGLEISKIESPSREGVRIVCDGKNILITGQNGTATVKAVCRFLEELGCRYFMDNPLGEVYPKSSTVPVRNFDITETPAFLHRHAKGPSWRGYEQALWTVWNGESGVNLEHSHSWGQYVPDTLFAAHPDFFAMNANGVRNAKGWLCTSNPELRDYFADKVVARIQKGLRNPSISPTDGRGYCQCPACKAQDDPRVLEPSSGTISITGRYLDFFDAVGKKVAAKSPDSILSFYCYADYTQPVDRKVSPNLCAFIAPIRYCRLHGMDNPNCPSCQQKKSMIDGWAKSASKMGYYAYNYDLAECTVPLSLLSVWKHDIPYLKNKGCVGVTIETISNWHIYGPQIYLALRLAYAPNANADALMEDYFLSFYGPQAGPVMKEYWMTIDTAQSKLGCHSGSFFAIPLIYTPDFLNKCEQTLAQAAKLAADDKQYSARVAMHTEGYKSALQYSQIRDAMNDGDFAKAKRIYGEMTARLERAASQGYANREYYAAYLRRFVSPAVEAGAAALAEPNRLISVLGDEWKLEYDEQNKGIEAGYQESDFNDAAWRKVATFSKTLDAQGLPDRMTVMWYRTSFDAPKGHRKLALLFTQIDGTAEVYVNGAKVGTSDKRNAPFEVPLGDTVREGRNSIAVRVDHSRMTELFLGGIVRPVVLIDKP